MNPEMPQKPQDELEASLTALLLGELPHEQAAALHQRLAQDADLAALYERLKQTINLVRETVSSPAQQTADQPAPLKLSEGRRQKLLQHFKTVVPKEFARPRRRAMPWLVPVGLAAAFMVILGAILLPRFSARTALSRSPSLAFRTWSLSPSAHSAQPMSVDAASRKDLPSLSRNDRMERRASFGKDSKAGLPPPAEAAPPLEKSAGTAIVLPKAGEPAEGETTARVTFGGQPEPAAVARLSGILDSSLDRANGVGGGGGFGGSKAGTPSSASVVEGRLVEVAAANDFFGQPERGGVLEASKTAAIAGDSMHTKQGDVGLADRVRNYPINATVGDAYFSLDPETHRVAHIADEHTAGKVLKPATPATPNAAGVMTWGTDAGEAPKPTSSATPPPPVASTPAQDFGNAGTISGAAAAPALGLHEQALADSLKAAKMTLEDRALVPLEIKLPAPAFKGTPKDVALKPAEVLAQATPAPPGETPVFGVGEGMLVRGSAGSQAWTRSFTVDGGPEVAATPLQSHGLDGTAGDLVVGKRAAVPSRPQTDVAALSRRLLSENKPAGNIQGKEEPSSGVEFFDLSSKYSANARAAGEVAAKGPQTLNYITAAAGNRDLGFQWYLDANRNPLPGSANSDADQAAALGDVPAAGRLFRSKADEVGGGLKAQVEEKVKSVELAYKADQAGQKSIAESERGAQQKLGLNVDSLNVVGYQSVPVQSTNAITLGATVASGRYPSSVVLPSAGGETSLALKESSGSDQKSRQFLEAKRNLEDLQRFRQILDTKIASEKIDVELPKTMSVEVVDKAALQSAEGPTLGERIRSGLGGKVERHARIKVGRDQSDITGPADRQQEHGYDPYFVQSEFELMQSEAVLGKVIDNLHLKEEWGKKQGGGTLTTQEALGRLKKSLDLRPVPNTSLIDVGVKSDSPDEAARIANAVAEAYRDQRLEQRKELSAGGIKALEARLAEQEKKVASAKQEMERLQEASKASSTGQSDVSPAKPAAPAPVPQPEVQTSDNAFSTFSLNVSDVSFKLAAASLEKGVMPEPATVRSEEFINAFDYRDPEPPPGVPVAFAWERAQYPFAQNRDLLRFSIKTAAQGRTPGRPLNLVLLLDNSGSMERADRVQIIREALRVLAGQLQAHDKLSVVTFARTARLWVDGVPGNQAAQVVEEVSGLTPQGGTNLEDAMNLAYQTALRHYLANGINRVVLLTDGAANLGNVDPEALKQKVEANRKQGIALDCFGIGWEGYNDDLLEVLSRNGDGRYGFINTPEEAATEFAGQLAGALHVAASDVKAQIEFNPARVTAYRQIGYAKHQLTKEQFRDNTVNAAQIGAAESGNALYVIAVNPGGDGPLATVRVRYRVPGTSDYHEHEWPVPYTGNAVALEQASPAMRLVATASAFSEWLVSSPYAAEVTPDRLLGYLSGAPEVYGADARPKKLEWMIRQAKSIAGK